ncbi:putative membrane protein YccC [Streptomyces sp. BK208]|uniref:FUSC family protein n=1 Tax=Streptomyces sp. BK208 TaxID=2512150 RepID=UPI0010609469|nr:FUSC family protein [Streptomyces sp. BK208]TDT36482.1 putative membrane protein YccC [Streptomyces sp. BK208]
MFRAALPASHALPPWLGHALNTQRGPVPWSAVVRGALAAGPLLIAALAAGRADLGVVAAIAAMLAGINDRPGSRRTSVRRIGVPALAGAAGLLAGTYAGLHLGAVVLTLVLTGLGLVAGGVSAVGPVASATGTQLLVGSAVGAGMPLPGPAWQSVPAFLAGAGWLLLLRLALPTPASLAGDRRLDFRFDGERAAVADVYEAVAALLDAVGTADAVPRRAALTAALDHAQDALAGPRLRRRASTAAERRLHARYAAALPLGEAATALAWAGRTVPARAAEGPRRLAAAVRAGTHAGPLPAPSRTDPALRALDDALLHAADAFDRGRGVDLHTRRRSPRALAGAVLGAGGREYGLRAGLCFGASAAIAQALHHGHWYGSHQHWYWLPATAVFLVKPDLGPLASRVLCRAAGTVLGALLFAGFAAVLPRPEGLVALVAVGGALVSVAARHFAAQTTVVTVLVLALVMVGGEPQASAGRIGETLLACAIVLVVGHLPLPGQRGAGIRAGLDAADAAAQAYLGHVLSESGDRATRWTLRREAYRTLAAARAAVARAAAELPALARHSEGADGIAAVLERLVDTTTACAVHLDDTGRLTPRHTERLAALRDELAERRGRCLQTRDA